MKIFFGVQTEGSGHCVQAIALKQILTELGHPVDKVIAAAKHTGLAGFFTKEFNIYEYDGVDFVFEHGRLQMFKTIKHNVAKIISVGKSFLDIIRIIKRDKPDVIFNFYDPLVGLTALFCPEVKYVSIGHQYAMTAKEYPKIKGYPFQKLCLKVLNYITSIRARVVALSFYEMKGFDCYPPLLRESSYEKPESQQDFILVYLMNQDLVPKLIEQAILYPDLRIECFTRLNKEFRCPPNLILNNLNGEMFLAKMKTCRGVVCSGGFETASEAILQGKDLLMVPIQDHFEQLANCNDAKQHKLGDWNNSIDLKYFRTPTDDHDRDIKWFYQIKPRIKKLLTELL